MEEKEVNLEDLGSKLKNLEREKLKLVRDLEQWNGEQSKLDTFERENRDLMQVCAILYILQCQFGCGILKMVGPKKQEFWPRINILKGFFLK